MTPSLTVVILTKNEARHITDCIASAAWADRVVVSDSFSDDGTPALAQAAGAQVMQRPFEGWARQRNHALDAVEADWIFFLDADERITPELATELRAVIQRSEVGWWAPRHNFIVGKRMGHAGWYPDYQLRLLKRGSARYDLSRPVHEVVELDGAEGHLRHHLLHYNYDSWAQFHAKQARYAAYEAGILKQRGLRPRFHNYLLQPLREFRRRYITLSGWRDGWHGLRLSALMAYYTYVTYVDLAKLWRTSAAQQ
ncbi:MAG: glycosyltransferase family 2 protein [Anaerolineae bacterium]